MPITIRLPIPGRQLAGRSMGLEKRSPSERRGWRQEPIRFARPQAMAAAASPPRKWTSSSNRNAETLGVPRNGALQTFLETHRRFVTEHLFSFANVCLGVLDVAGPGLLVNRLGILAGD